MSTSPNRSEVNVVQKLDKDVQHMLATIVALEALLPKFERMKLTTMMTDARNDESISAEAIFGLSAIAGFAIAIQVDDGQKNMLRKVASGN